MGKQYFAFKGMTRDLDIAKSSNQYAYEVRNLRLTAQEDSTLLAYTTEKGNRVYSIVDSTDAAMTLLGNVVGYCVLNNYIVLFTHVTPQGGRQYDCIYKLIEAADNKMQAEKIYQGFLGFTDNTVLETLGVYENEDIQKVYWVDGVHQPRMINIMEDYSGQYETEFCPFDFLPKMKLEETVTITKQNNVYGVFTAGTIQYILCYYMNNGQRSNAFYVSPINYVTKSNRGGQPGETLSNAFGITINNVDSNWDNILIYSVSRSSENSTPVCRKVTEISIHDADSRTAGYTYIDNGLNTESVDYSEILFLGGGNIIPYTMEQKNNTLFFGNIKENSFYINDDKLFENLKECKVEFEYSTAYADSGLSGYTYTFQLDNDQSEISTFMFGELYKFGLIFQNEYGQWSNVVPIGDYWDKTDSSSDYYDVNAENGYFRCNLTPSDGNVVKRIVARIHLTQEACSTIESIDSIKKLKVVRLKDNNEVVAQGVVCPTVFNKERKAGRCYAQSSWFFRAAKEPHPELYNTLYQPYSEHNTNIQSKRWNELHNNFYFIRGEIISAEAVEGPVFIPNTTDVTLNDSDFFVDWNVLTFHSPDVTYNKIADGNFNVDLIGHTTFDRSLVSEYITTKTVAACNSLQDLIIPQAVNFDYTLMSKGQFKDWCYMMHIGTTSPDSDTNKYNKEVAMNHATFVWHRNGSLGNQPYKFDNIWNGELNTKCVASLRYSCKTKYLSTKNTFVNNSEIKFYNDDSSMMILPSDANDNVFSGEKYYFGEVESLLSPSGYNLYSENLCTGSEYGSYHNKKYFPVSRTEVMMKYKSTRHGIINLGYTQDHLQNIPDVSKNTRMYARYHRFWETNSETFNVPILKAIIDCVAINKNDIFFGGRKVSYINPPMLAFVAPAGYVFIRKGLVDLQAKINVGDYIAIKNSDVTFTYGDALPISLNYTILRLVDDYTNPNDPSNHNLYPDTTFIKNAYYIFETVVGVSSSSGTGVTMANSDDDAYFKNGGSSYTVTAISGGKLWNGVQLNEIQLLAQDSDNTDPYYVTYYQIELSDSTSLSTVNPYNILNSGVISEPTIPYTFLVNLTRSLYHRDDFINTVWYIASKGIEVSDIAPSLTLENDEIGGNDSTVENPENAQNSDEDNSQNVEVPIIADIADAYYQRFDCLKTYPYSDEDPNQLVEIFSFMVQTRINLDGRWDINRGLLDNTLMNNTNFGLLNQGYTQEDNLFSSSYLDDAKFSSDYHPNQIMWTGTKEYGADIDNWTHIIPTSSLDMDGVYGKVSALRLWNNNLMFFQDKAFGVVQYDERNAITTTSGVPIELGNSGKVDGKRYVSNNIGCSNKQSIQITQRGLYFADDNTRELYRYGSEGPEGISKSKGFNTYFYNPNVQFNNIKTFYDPKLKDVYFEVKTNVTTNNVTTVNTECLVFNEQIDEFTSFFDYDMKYMFAYEDSLISVKNNSLWRQFAGDYLSIYNNIVPYSLEFISSEYPTMDKTFTNIEFRSDVLEETDTLYLDNNNIVVPFTHIKAWNEYQNTGYVEFENQLIRNYGANINQKFRIWRADIPRNANSVIDRIRNPWAKIGLYKRADNTRSDTPGGDTPVTPTIHKTVIHDVAVSYV